MLSLSTQKIWQTMFAQVRVWKCSAVMLFAPCCPRSRRLCYRNTTYEACLGFLSATITFNTGICAEASVSLLSLAGGGSQLNFDCNLLPISTKAASGAGFTWRDRPGLYMQVICLAVCTLYRSNRIPAVLYQQQRASGCRFDGT
jgi:hypothetical protein